MGKYSTCCIHTQDTEGLEVKIRKLIESLALIAGQKTASVMVIKAGIYNQHNIF